MPATLNSWKEIATYMDRGVRTVQRWENGGLPIRRVGAGTRAPYLLLRLKLTGGFANTAQRHRPTM